MAAGLVGLKTVASLMLSVVANAPESYSLAGIGLFEIGSFIERSRTIRNYCAILRPAVYGQFSLRRMGRKIGIITFILTAVSLTKLLTVKMMPPFGCAMIVSVVGVSKPKLVS